MDNPMGKWNRLDPKEVVRNGYDQIGEQYAEWSMSSRAEERAHYASVVLNSLAPGAQVLDIGCGAGVPTTQVLARQFTVTGVDLSERQIARARRNVPRAQFIQADMATLDFTPESFDGVVAFYSLIHVPRREQPKLLQRIASWLRLGGLFVATMGTHSIDWDFGDDFFGTTMFWSSFDIDTNRRLVEEAALEIETMQVETAIEFGAPVRFLWVVARKPELIVA